jgi:hypothetical protein
MSLSIQWQLFLRASTSEKAARLVKRVTQLLDRELADLEGGPYWKDPGLFQVSFETPLADGTMGAAVSEVLILGGRLAHQWIVSPPQLYAGDRWEFMGTAAETCIAIPGVSTISFRVANFQQTPAAEASLQTGASA